MERQEGQITWAGIIVPLADVTWANVIETSSRFRGLDVDGDFLLTYKDDDGEVIDIKNEDDLLAAIKWAKLNGVPCLCLDIPCEPMDDDISNEDWIELQETRSQSYNEDITEEPNTGNYHAGGDVSGQEEDLYDHEQYNQPAHLEPQNNEQQPNDEQEGVYPSDEPSTLDNVDKHQDESSEIVEPSATHSQEDRDNATEANDVQSAATHTPECPTGVEETTEKSSERKFFEEIVDIVHRLPTLETQESRRVLLNALSKPETFAILGNLLRHSIVQESFASCVRSIQENPDQSVKIAHTQLLNLLHEEQEAMSLLSQIPDITEVLESALFLLNSTVAPPLIEEEQKLPQTDFLHDEPKPKPTHKYIYCNACESNADLAFTSKTKGFNNVHGEIRGIRYKSSVLPNYDLCEHCEATGLFQDEAGPFLKIVNSETAPDAILCLFSKSSSSDAGSIGGDHEALAEEFKEFVRKKRSGQKPVVSNSPDSGNLRRCKHRLTQFVTEHPNFTCDACRQTQSTGSIVYGCRECNFDLCETCHVTPQDSANTQMDKGPEAAVPNEEIEKVDSSVTEQTVKSPEKAVTNKRPEKINEIPAQTPAPRIMNTKSSVQPTQPSAPPARTYSPPQSKLVSDGNLADGSIVRPGERIEKIWRARNTGSERWQPGTKLVHIGGLSFDGPRNGVEVPLAGPNEVVDLKVPVVMPSLPGRYTSYWRMMTPSGDYFGYKYWMTVNVVSPPQQVTGSTARSATNQPHHFLSSIPSAPPASYPSVVDEVRGAPSAPVQSSASFFPSSPSRFVDDYDDDFVYGAPVYGDPALNNHREQDRPVQQHQRENVPSARSIVLSEHEANVARLVSMDFTDVEKIDRLLKELNGNVDAVIDRLLEENN